MEINYDDERFQEVATQKEEALSELENTYAGMIDDSNAYYQAQIDASKDWANQQQRLQQEKTDFTIEQIEQQKDQTTKEYQREQSGAYVDWQKQSNQYGATAEQMAAQGFTNSGYSESSKVSMYNTYQNRVATAKESYNVAILNYNNAIKDAQLQNNSVLAEIAYNALQEQLALSLQGFQYENQLLLDKAQRKVELDNAYYGRYQDVLQQMNTENALAEQIRQYDQNYALDEKRYNESVRQYDQNYALDEKRYNESVRQYDQNYALDEKRYNESIRQYNQNYLLSIEKLEEEIRQFDTEIARLKENDKNEYNLEIKRLEQQKALAEMQLEEEIRQFDIKNAQNEKSVAEQPVITAPLEAPVVELKEQSVSKSSSTANSGRTSAGGGVSSAGKTHSGGTRSFSNSSNSKSNSKTNSKTTTHFTSYESAVAYLRASGVTKGNGGLMTMNEWAKKKARESSSAEAQYSTYTDYLNSYVEWKRSYPD